MTFFQSSFAVRQRSKDDSAAFGSEVASDIIFRATHRGDRLVTFTAQRRGDSARVHSSAGAASLARDKRQATRVGFPARAPDCAPSSETSGGYVGQAVLERF